MEKVRLYVADESAIMYEVDDNHYGVLHRSELKGSYYREGVMYNKEHFKPNSFRPMNLLDGKIFLHWNAEQYVGDERYVFDRTYPSIYATPDEWGNETVYATEEGIETYKRQQLEATPDWVMDEECREYQFGRIDEDGEMVYSTLRHVAGKSRMEREEVRFRVKEGYYVMGTHRGPVEFEPENEWK